MEITEMINMVKGSGNTVFFGGAGVSTESDIPDFRSESGLYQAQEVYGYPPEILLSKSFFIGEPGLFFRYYKENLIYSGAKPNAAHIALAKLEKAGLLSAVVTQNIDGLHQAAGSVNVHELHGSNHRQYCMGCGKRFGLDYILDPGVCDGFVPKCEKCGGTVRPDVVLYEEQLDEGTVQSAISAVASADCLIVGGTSLNVYPAAGLIRYYNGNKLILINLSETSYDSSANLIIREKIGEALSAAVGL